MTPKPTVDLAAAPKGNRRSPRLASSSAATPPPIADPEAGKRKKAKKAHIPVTAAATKEETEVKDQDPESPKKKKAKTVPTPTPVTAAEEETEGKEPPLKVEQSSMSELENVEVSKEKTIVVEHFKQCNSFKTRELQVKEALEKDVEGVKVVVNLEKPRKGCFEVREEGGEVSVSLLDMKRPFKEMEDLNMGEVISEIVEKIK